MSDKDGNPAKRTCALIHLPIKDWLRDTDNHGYRAPTGMKTEFATLLDEFARILIAIGVGSPHQFTIFFDDADEFIKRVEGYRNEGLIKIEHWAAWKNINRYLYKKAKDYVKEKTSNNADVETCEPSTKRQKMQGNA